MSETEPLELGALEPVIEPAAAIARVLGQPWNELPQDLFIPPDALEVILEAFEGPLDLLLWLIRRNNLNVLDIPMADLTRQYIEYIEAMRVHRLELAAEYLVMAAMLIEIKSRMLLPRPERLEEGDEHDPRAELVRRLLEYEQIKLGAQKLDAVPQMGRDFQMVSVYLDRLAVKRLPQVSPDDLMAAWADILKRARMNTRHRIGRQELSVREHMSRILKHLQEQGRSLFSDLFPDPAGRPELVVTFLALLELTRERLVDIVQTEPFAPIWASACITD
ncbi:segregation/condensation protein A [Parasulfuritortus cantonensis]|uniref:Segregation and condensation protein A n=1 Tax=Parasulfuritortus cantonensis TaxID=2528202 RepID=A0A4R1BR20_9PROT|nr:segregation/condensation protein A [Parasulfuritortus cantonensis]TCJ19756.1 segregation/condensation protein A [Parasulfuritortus cantonensis]